MKGRCDGHGNEVERRFGDDAGAEGLLEACQQRIERGTLLFELGVSAAARNRNWAARRSLATSTHPLTRSLEGLGGDQARRMGLVEKFTNDGRLEKGDAVRH